MDLLSVLKKLPVVCAAVSGIYGTLCSATITGNVR